MKKTLICAGSALMLFAASCKEHGTPIDLTDGGPSEDTTYVATVEAPQDKRILIEELSGVTCTNCPQGTVKLEELMTNNPGLISLITVHVGTYTDPIPGKSIQSFKTADGEALMKQVWGEQGSKPTACFDRLPLGSDGNKYFVDGYINWASKLIAAKAQTPTTPVNLSVTSKYNDAKDQYDIEAVVKYTQAVTDQYALQLFLSEDKIIDVQELSSTTFNSNYEFNHVFRKAITPATSGKLFLNTMASKEAGRVYVYRTSLKIDKTDEKQKFWVPANMKVTAFVSKVAPDDKRILQVQETKLIP